MVSRSLPKKLRYPSEEEGNSPLHRHSYNGDYSAALMLILANEDVNAKNTSGETPLHLASSQGHLEIMLLLLDADADINVYDNDSLTPLHQALMHGNRNGTELLICYGANIHNKEGLAVGAMSPLEFGSHVPVCRDIMKEAEGVCVCVCVGGKYHLIGFSL